MGAEELMPIEVGTAGWSIPRADAERFDASGSALQRYASRFPVVEINSSFHRSHRPETWARWHDEVPDTFRFSVKLPKEVTHWRKLRDCHEPIATFLGEIAGLRHKLGAVLVQLPPKFEFDRAACSALLDQLAAVDAAVVCEPRHPGWFTPRVDDFLAGHRVSRVAADPAITPRGAVPGGWGELAYYRLHGSPVIYRSSYVDRLEAIGESLLDSSATSKDVWCIFDNTASSAATQNALSVLEETRRDVEGAFKPRFPNGIEQASESASA